MASEQDKQMMTITDAITLTGLSKATLHRRVDAWGRGDRSPYALKGGRTGGDRGTRMIDRLDAERARLQGRGDLPADMTTAGYAAHVQAQTDAATPPQTGD
jgi:hypothetical protein